MATVEGGVVSLTSPDYIVQAELTRAAFEQGPDAIVIVDNVGTILMVNAQAELLSGRPRRELVGQKAEVLVPSDNRERHKALRANYMRNPYRRLMGPDRELAIVQRTEDGEIDVPVEINLAPVPISIGTVVVLSIRQKSADNGGFR